MGRIKQPSGATPYDDIDGLIPGIESPTIEAIYELELKNTNKILPKYFLGTITEKRAPFTYEWLLKFHKEMLGDVWDWAGKIRATDKTVGVPKHEIAEELNKFVGDYQSWIDHSHDILEISTKIHHRLVWIHPFENGNGRWARFVSNIFLNLQRAPIINWPSDKLYVEGEFRERYLRALKEADKSNISELLKLHKEFQGKE
jgi:Fic-DOC domain mobile mystery protein B